MNKGGQKSKEDGCEGSRRKCQKEQKRGCKKRTEDKKSKCLKEDKVNRQRTKEKDRLWVMLVRRLGIKGMRAESLSNSSLVYFRQMIREVHVSSKAQFTQPFLHFSSYLHVIREGSCLKEVA